MRAWRPTFCSASDSVPGLSSSFDSGEPFCRSQTVANANSANWRYSDCQFSITALPKCEVERYPQKVMPGSPCVSCSWL